MRTRIKKLSLEDLHLAVNHLFAESGFDLHLDSKDSFELKSKKHYVFKSTLLPQNRDVCVKFFNDEIPLYHQRWKNEVQNMTILPQLSYLINTPELIASAQNVIVYEFLIGDNLFDLLLEKRISLDTLRSLAEIFSTLHDRGFIYGDARLRNMILTKKSKIYLIDPEEMQKGDSLEDVAEFLCSFIDFTPGIFQNNMDLYYLDTMIQFLQYYLKFAPIGLPEKAYLDREFWVEIILNSLKQITMRRSISLSPSKWSEINQMLLYYLKKMQI
ncbi:hypothetical protein NEF87_005001 [Candidatus Lokiarchaeum ossiferum]|uniref:Protein kinase domain-containing protein n=1 Tax=Candidatus Lokiarchaeum ossiferum TaxID=2951803 RepID=A0ABY6HYV3_9ARCH|nr:hypothetical protein NEF87_005001 [Candidatus Lokiarchaeum sp. B-35]